jgi:hypothetical protein
MSVNQNFPEVSPSLLLDFANSRTLDPRITFTRSSIGTYVASNGLIKTAAADEPRFDHDPDTGESLGLLIEESRTNLLTYSENLTSGAGWSNVSQSSMTATNVSEENPGGGSTTTQITGGGVNSWWAKTFTASVSTTYQISLWVKVADGGADFNVGIRFYAPGATSNAIIVGTGFNVTSSWKRVTGYVTSSANFSGSFSRYIVLQLDNTRSFYAWGIQVEAGAFPTSYIPTSGSAATRAKDVAKITGTNFTNFYNTSEGTLYSSFIRNLQINGFLVGLGYDGSNYIGMGYTKDTGNNDVYIQPLVGSIFGHPSVGGNVKVKSIVSYSSSGASGCINGNTVVSETASGGLPSGSNGALYIGTSAYDPATIGTGLISSVVYYSQRLTDTQLQNLTK